MTTQEAKRKLTTILSADVKGYSRLMGEDEEWTVRTLNAYREVIGSLIQQHRGRVIDTAGDSVLAEFASVVDTVHCAVEIQQVLRAKNAMLPANRRMEFRIGINLGDVIEEGERIYGDGVNIAARVEGLAEAGGICISESAYQQIENKVPLRYDYLGEHEVKNIAKPVRVYKAQIEFGAVARKPVEVASKEKMAFPLPDKPSIAVLPFVNMSDDPKQEFFSDGMTEEIITALSKSPDLFVIARTSTFIYKGKSVDVKRVCEELGVHYVLEGSVRRSGDNLRITAQLVDAMTGYHLWADRYDRSLREIFAIQDEITLKIMEAVHVKLEPGENILETGKGAGNLEAFLKFLEAREHFHHWNKEEISISRKLFEEVIALDQDYAAAYLFLAATHMVDVWIGTSKSPKESVGLAIELGEKAIALDASVAAFQAYLANSYIMARQFEKAVTLAENALALRQDSSEVLFWAANVISWSGKSEEAIPLFQKSIRLNPFAPGYYFHAFSLTYRLAGRYSEGLEQAKKAVERDPKNPITHIAMVASYILLGREEEARVAAADVLRINPNFSVEQYVRGLPLKDQLQAERYIETLRKAGLK
jgi:adenylate cyclase